MNSPPKEKRPLASKALDSAESAEASQRDRSSVKLDSRGASQFVGQ